MRLVAVGDLALRPLRASLRCVSTLEAVETQSLRRETLDTFLHISVGENVAVTRLVDAAADSTDACRLLFRWRRCQTLCI